MEDQMPDLSEEGLKAEDIPEELTKDQENLKLLVESFYLYDLNDDGKLSAKELAEVLHSMGQKPNSAKLSEMISTYETNGIDLKGFLKLMNEMKFAVTCMDDLKDAWLYFDPDNTGYIGPTDLRKILSNVGENLSEAEMEEIIGVADMDEDGKITFDDFVKIMQFNNVM